MRYNGILPIYMHKTKHSVLAIGLNISISDKNKIQRHLRLEDITLDTASIKDIIIKIIDGEIIVDIKGKDLSSYTYVWIQSGWTTTHMAYILDLYLRTQNIPHNQTNVYYTKLSDIFFLALRNIPIPNTFFHNGLKINEENISEIVEICKIPCIFKTSLGSLGENVFLIDEKKEIASTIRDKKKYNTFLFQEYIPNDFDYRIIIANGKPTSACIRTRINDKFRNNVALGASETFINLEEVPEGVLDIATRSAIALELDWAGVDVVTHRETNKNYILEVNRRPGLTKKSTEMVAAYNYITELVSNF